MSTGPELVELREGLCAHVSGAAWLPDQRTLLAADLHLGYAWAQRRRGELGPVATASTVPALRPALEKLGAHRLVILGDLVHSRRPSAQEFVLITEAVKQLRDCAEVILIEGNHDRGLAVDFGFTAVPEWRSGAFVAAHGDRLPPDRQQAHGIYGHWHPVWQLTDGAGAKIRYRAFVTTKRATVVPALSPFSAGLILQRPWPADLREALGAGRRRVVITTGRSIRAL